MEVILLEDLKGIGSKGATVNVKPGHARNYLLPRRLAIPASSKAGNLYQELQRQREVADEKLIAKAREEAKRIDGLEINIPAAANEEDTLFGSITNSDIADALERAGHKIDRRKIGLEEHVKQLGKYDVPVHIHPGVTATIKIWVVRP